MARRPRVSSLFRALLARRPGAFTGTAAGDARIGVRLLARNPGFAAAAMLTLAIGVGLATAAFSAVHASLLRRLPFADAERLVIGEKTIGGQPAGWVSRLDYYDFRDAGRSFEGLAAMVDGAASVVATTGTEPWLARVALVTGNLFPTLGVAPVLGRGFLPDEETTGDAPVTLISHALWRTRFAASPAALGATITVGGRPLTIVGVMPERFRFMADADLWCLVDRKGPVDPTRDSHSHLMIGRLRNGGSLARAEQDLNAIAAQLAARFPSTNARKGVRLTPLRDHLVRDSRRTILMLMTVTALVLLVACANVAGLLLARGQQRLPEMALRSALGGSRSRLVRQLLTESVILTTAGGLLGLLVARGTLALLRPLLSGGPAGLESPALDAPVLAFALGTSVAAGALVGVVPALRGTSASPAEQLGTGRGVAEPRHGARVRGALVVLQLAFSAVLVVLCGLFVQSLIRANAVDLGFAPDRVFTATIRVPADDYPTPEARRAFLAELFARISAVPGVASVSGVSKLPILGRTTDWPVWRADRPAPAPNTAFSPLARWVFPRYFHTMGMRLLAGRDFTDRDTGGAPKVVILTESTARALYGTDDPVGRAVTVWGQEGSFEVIGVVADAVLESATKGGKSAAMYLSAPQVAGIGALAVRARGDSAGIGPAVRGVVRQLNPNVLLANERSMRSIVEEGTGDLRVVMRALMLFGAAALAVTAVGLFGALSYHVSRQRQEIGVRMAIGASRAGVLGLVLRRGATLAGAGLSLGAAGAVAASHLVSGQLFGTSPLDAATYAGALFVMALVASVACLLPAWRATQVSPLNALRGR